MGRGVGEFAAVAELPEWLVVIAALLTQLADVWFLFVLVGCLYWFGESLPGSISFDRGRAAFVLALALGYRAVTTTFKEWLAFPRPPAADDAVGITLVPWVFEPLYISAATATGFGFPSGHTVGVVLIYGGIALLVGTRRAYLTAAIVVAVVALSRIVLQVHYLVDILFGAVVGIAFLAAAYLAGNTGSNAGRVFMLALFVALFGPILGGFNFDTMAALGGVLGARIAWGITGEAVVHEQTTEIGGILATLVGGAFALLFALIYIIEPKPHVAFLGMAVVFGGVVAAPLAGEAAEQKVSGKPF